MLQPVHLARFGAVVLFTAIATGGWDNRFAAAALAATLLAIALLLAPTRGGRRALGRAPLPWRAGAGFACVMALGLLQVALAAAVWPDAALFLNENGLNAPGAVDLFAAQVELVKLAGLGAAFILGMAAGRGQAEFDRVLAGVTAAGLVYVLYALGVHAFAAFGPIPPQRLLGGLGSANVAAGVLHVVMFIAARGVLRTLAASSGAPLSFYDRARQVMRERPISTPALVLATIALLLTASRAGVAMGAGGLLVLIAWAPATRLDQSITRRRGLARIAIAIGVAAIVGSIFGDRLEQRFETYDELSDPRFALFQAHGAAIADRPWLGYGYGSFQSVNNAIMTAQNARALEPAGSMHSVPLQWLEEGGVLGLAAIGATLAMLYFRLVASAFSRTVSRSRSRLGVVLFGVVAVHSLIEYTLNVYAVAALFTLLLGAFWAYASTTPGRSRNERAEPSAADARAG